MNTEEMQSIFSCNCSKWFLDSGSLLGIVREGEFLKHDHDIDIGLIYNGNINYVENIIDQLKNKGFRVIKFFWGNRLYKFKLIPNFKEVYPYILDVQIYYLKDNNYLCPQMVFKDNLSFLNRIRRKIIRLKKSDVTKENSNIFERILLKMIIKNDISIQYKRKASSLYDLYFWRIPCDYLKSLNMINGFPVFEKKEDYLTYRYGDWKVPITNWVFTRDDRALNKCTYQDICSLYDEFEAQVNGVNRDVK